jgi:MFS family permease
VPDSDHESREGRAAEAARDRRVGLLLFALGWGANHFTTLLVVYRKSLQLSPSALGVLFGVYALGLVPGLILAGRASDRWGRRALVLPSALLAMGASGLLAFGARGFSVLLAGRFLYGLGMGSAMSPGSVWVQELSPPGAGARRATLALSAGFGLGPLVSGLVAELAPAPMVAPYLVHIIVMAVAVARVRAVPETAPRAPSREPGRARPRVGDLVVLLEVLPAAPWAFGFAAATMAVLPGMMRPHVGLPVVYTGFVILATLSFGVLLQPFVARIGRHADLVGLGAGALGIWLAGQAAAALSPSLVFPAAMLAGAGYGLVMTGGLAEVVRRVPGHVRGTAVGIYYVLTYIGFSLPFIHANVAERAGGDAQALRATALVALGCLLARAAVKARRAAAPTRDQA